MTLLSAVMSAACLSLEPPQSRLASPTPLPIQTVIPSATPVPFTATATSTVTPTFTASPTITPLPPLSQFPGDSSSGGIGNPVIIGNPPAQAPTTSVPIGFPFGTAGGSTSPGTGNPGTGALGGGTPGGTAGGGETGSWECNGDERMDFIPLTPVVGDAIHITITSKAGHGYVHLAEPLPYDKVAGGTGGPGYYWQWKKSAEKVGNFVFNFYSGPRPEYRCVRGEVQETLAVPPTATPIPRILPTPTPSATPRPDH